MKLIIIDDEEKEHDITSLIGTFELIDILPINRDVFEMLRQIANKNRERVIVSSYIIGDRKTEFVLGNGESFWR